MAHVQVKSHAHQKGQFELLPHTDGFQITPNLLRYDDLGILADQTTQGDICSMHSSSHWGIRDQAIYQQGDILHKPLFLFAT